MCFGKIVGTFAPLLVERLYYTDISPSCSRGPFQRPQARGQNHGGPQPRDTPYALHPQDPWSIIFGLFLLRNRQTKKTTQKQTIDKHNLKTVFIFRAITLGLTVSNLGQRS